MPSLSSPQSNQTPWVNFCLSFLIHCIIMLLAALFYPKGPASLLISNNSKSRPKPIQIKTIPKIKRPGVKKGLEEFTLSKIGAGGPPIPIKPASQDVPTAPPLKMVDLGLKGPVEKKLLQKNARSNEHQQNTNPIKEISSDPSFTKREFQKIVQQSGVKGPSLYNSNLSYSIKLPEGVDADELNAYEMKFFIFNRRVFESYVHSLIYAYQRFQQKHPGFNLEQVPSDRIIGDVIYDQEGNVKSIKIQKSANTPFVEQLFLDALSNNKIMNPPKTLIKDNEFTCSYEFVINQRM